MKKVLIPLIAFLALTVNAHAQDKMGKKANQHHKHEKGMMAKELNFTDAQKAQAKAINEDSHKKLQELNKNESITVKEQRDRKAAIFKERKTKMDGLLTAEQKTKMTQLKAERKVKKEEGYAKRLDKIKTNLSLTDEQVAKLKNQRAATLAKAEKIKNNESLNREQKKEQMMTLKTEAKAQYDKIFTADQLKKKEEMKKAHGDRGRVRK
jgi:Spy/CpxP family protein refolding chaperone